MAIVLFLLFIVLPFLEIVVILQVGSVIGVWATLGLMIVSAVVGSWLCKREGLGVLQRINGALEAGRIPTTELADGALILFAGALMVTPGFLTDLLGILLLLPPTRALFRLLLVKRLGARLARSVAGAGPAGFTFIRMGGFADAGPTGSGDVIDADSWEDPVADGRFGQLPGAR